MRICYHISLQSQKNFRRLRRRRLEKLSALRGPRGEGVKIGPKGLLAGFGLLARLDPPPPPPRGGVPPTLKRSLLPTPLRFKTLAQPWGGVARTSRPQHQKKRGKASKSWDGPAEDGV